MFRKFSRAVVALVGAVLFIATGAHPANDRAPASPRYAAALEMLSEMRHFDAEDGLTSPFVVGVALDSNGTVWAGTRDGLAYYDGRFWREMPLPAGRIFCVEATNEYGAMVGTDKGAYSFMRGLDGEIDVEVFTPFEHPYLRSHRDSLKRNVYSVDEGATSGTLWFGTETGAKHYAVFEWIAVDTSSGLPVDTVTDVLVGEGGNVWLATPEGLFLRVGDETLPIELPDGVSPDGVNDLARDPVTGEIWAATEAGGYRFAGEAWSVLAGTEGLAVECIILDDQGTLYAAGAFELLAWFADGRTFGTESSHRITDLALGPAGVVWVGTYGGGLYRWAPTESGEIGWSAGPVTRIVIGGDGVLQVAAGNELWALSDDGVLSRALETRKWSEVYAALSLSDGSVWLGTDTGAYRVKEGRVMMSLDRTSLLGGAPVRSLALDGEGILWIGAGSGVFQLSLQLNRLTPWREDAENALYPLAASSDSTVWLGAKIGVYAMFDAKVHGITHAGGTLLGKVRAGAVDREGTFWFGDDEGHVVRVHAVEDTARRWEAELFGASDGIRGRLIRGITPGPDGSIWIATDSGVNRYLDGLWGYYGRAEGLRNRDAWSAVHALPGIVFVGGERGLELLRINDEPPETRIVSIPERVAPEGNVTVTLWGTDRWKRTPSHRLRYSWRLDGGRWSEPDRFQRIVLGDVPAGQHLFEARALDGDLNWDPTPARAVFRVEAPLWLRWWVIVSAVVILVLAGGFIKRLASMRSELASLRRQHGGSDSSRD